VLEPELIVPNSVTQLVSTIATVPVSAMASHILAMVVGYLHIGRARVGDRRSLDNLTEAAKNFK
jgi:hypothetical protein